MYQSTGPILSWVFAQNHRRLPALNPPLELVGVAKSNCLSLSSTSRRPNEAPSRPEPRHISTAIAWRSYHPLSSLAYSIADCRMAHGLIALARQIRGMYRQLRAESRLLYSNWRFPSINEVSRRELQSVLRARINTVNTPVRVILFLPINNWEVDLKSAFESLSVVDMF